MASFQPPEYHTQLTFFADSRSPIVGWSRGGRSCFPVTFAGCGVCAVYAVFTTYPVGVTSPSLVSAPLGSGTAIRSAGAPPGLGGPHSPGSQMWLRNDPANAHWKNLSATW